MIATEFETELFGGRQSPDHIFRTDLGRKSLVEAFFKILPEITGHLGKLVGALDPGVHEFDPSLTPVTRAAGHPCAFPAKEIGACRTQDLTISA